MEINEKKTWLTMKIIRQLIAVKSSCNNTLKKPFLNCLKFFKTIILLKVSEYVFLIN